MNRSVMHIDRAQEPESWGPARFTAAEFETMIDAGAFGDNKVELVRGELLRMSPPEKPHSRWQTNVLIALLAHVPAELLLIEIGITLGEDTMVAGDMAVLRRPVEGKGRLTPDDVALVVEVAVSSLRKDLGLKRAEYALAGIPVYWVVDPDRATTHVFSRPVDGEYADGRTVPFDQPLTVPGTDAAILLA